MNGVSRNLFLFIDIFKYPVFLIYRPGKINFSFGTY